MTRRRPRIRDTLTEPMPGDEFTMRDKDMMARVEWLNVRTYNSKLGRVQRKVIAVHLRLTHADGRDAGITWRSEHNLAKEFIPYD